MNFLDKYEYLVNNLEVLKYNGKVKQVVGLTVEGTGPQANLGEICHILVSDNNGNEKEIEAEVVGFREDSVILMPYENISGSGISQGSPIVATGKPLEIPVTEGLLGRVIDGRGKPIDGKGVIYPEKYYSIFNTPPNALDRPRIKEKLGVGIKAIDGLLTVGSGQRIGIFSGSGVGKSTLMGMIARYTEADVNVIALIGERGREVKEFIENELGEEGLKRSVVVVATSDQPPILRLRGAFIATTIAEYFRDKGNRVVLMMDSITRFARAQREIGLAVGEPPSTRGFPPSVFALLPVLLERAGTSKKGTITGFYTVLVEADDMNEPIADNVRGILDGHIVLSRDLASLGHYPAIDILNSISRLMIHIVSKEHLKYAKKIREILATYKEAYDLINIGAYAKGSNPRIDYAIEMIDKVNDFLTQDINEHYSFEETINMLISIFNNENLDKTDRNNNNKGDRRYGKKISVQTTKVA